MTNTTKRSDFGIWLLNELDKRNMRQADLYKGIDSTSSTVSHMITGRFKPSVSMCRDIAKFLDIGELEVFRAAGIILEDTGSDPFGLDPFEETLIQKIRKLTNEEKQDVFEYAAFKLQRRKTNPVTR